MIQPVAAGETELSVTAEEPFSASPPRLFYQGCRFPGRCRQAHEERYRQLLHHVEYKEVFEKSTVQMWECINCGHIVIGTKAPEICPVCGYKKSFFEVRKENYQ